MKKFVFFLLFAAALHAQDKIDFRDKAFAEVLEIAKTENKPVMYMGYASWCEHCKKMKSEVVTNKAVADFFNANFICIAQDMENGEGIEMRKKYGVRAFPIFLFISPKGQLLYSVGGELNANEFMAEGRNALDQTKQFPFLKANFDADPKNPEKCLAYVSALRRSNFDTEKVAKQYFSGMQDNQMVTETNWRIIANGIRDIDSREFQYVLKNQSAFAGVSSAKRVEKKIVNIVQETLTPFVDRLDTVGYMQKRPSAAAIGMRKTDSLVFALDLKIFENAGGWNTYQKIAREYVPKIAWNNPSQLKAVAAAYMNNVDGRDALDDAISWAKRALEIKDEYATQIMIARLYLKKGDKENARKWAEKARGVALGYQWDTKYADEVLNQIKR